MNPGVRPAAAVRLIAVAVAVAFAGAGAGCRGCGGGGPVAPTTPRPPEVVALIAKLKARDALIRTLYVEGTITEGTGAAVPCWWAQDDRRMAFEKYGPPHGARTVSANGEIVELAGTALMKRQQVDAGDLPFEPALPPVFGLGTGVCRWSTFLAWSPRVVVLGRESVGGRDCLKVACEQVPGTTAGWANPVVGWFDDQGTGLAIRYAALMKPGALARAGVTAADEGAHTVDVDGSAWVLFQVSDIQAVRELASGVTIGARTQTSLPAFAQPQTWTTQVTDARLNGSVDPAWFAVPARQLSRTDAQFVFLGTCAAAWLLVALGWSVWHSRRRRGDPPWPSGDDPEVVAGRRAMGRLVWLAVPVVIGDGAMKATYLTTQMGLETGRLSDAGPALGGLGLAGSIAVGDGLLLVAALRLDRVLRGRGGAAAAAVALMAFGGVAGGLPWVAVVGRDVLTFFAQQPISTVPLSFAAAVAGLGLAQLPLVAVGLLAAAWRPRVARAVGH